MTRETLLKTLASSTCMCRVKNASSHSSVQFRAAVSISASLIRARRCKCMPAHSKKQRARGCSAASVRERRKQKVCDRIPATINGFAQGAVLDSVTSWSCQGRKAGVQKVSGNGMQRWLNSNQLGTPGLRPRLARCVVFATRPCQQPTGYREYPSGACKNVILHLFVQAAYNCLLPCA